MARSRKCRTALPHPSTPGRAIPRAVLRPASPLPSPCGGVVAVAGEVSLPRLGIGQWFHFEDEGTLDRAIELMLDLGVRDLRTGVSWADYHRPGGKAWYRRQMERLSNFNVLLSIWHTPPSLAEGGVCNGPPRRLRDFADFVNHICQEYGEHFDEIELWNEPNNRYKWDFTRFDPQWRKFGAMMVDAAHWAQRIGRRTVLGGMIPVDPDWLRLMQTYGVLDFIDVVAIHGFPEMWWDDAPNWDWFHTWKGWPDKIARTAEVAGDRPVWITETGLATWDLHAARPSRHALQCERLQMASRAPADRVYWYSLIDLDPEKSAIEGFHVDENEYHLGLVDWKGHRKPACELFARLLADPLRAKGPTFRDIKSRRARRTA